MIKTFRALASPFALCLGLTATLPGMLAAQSTGAQRLDFAGLRTSGHQGQFNAVTSDSAGNLYLLLDEKDGVRLLKTDAGATIVLAQTLVGAAGDVGLAMALDPAGNIYVTGSSTSGTLRGTAGAVFPSPADQNANPFFARFSPALKLTALTFSGSSRTAVSSIAATADAVFITGVIYGSGLPVTPSGIIQAPAFGSMQNGFVEKFSSDGTTLFYATYLSGQGGDTSPEVVAADASDNAYVAGFTTSSGFPTVAALVPRALSPTSGFLTQLTPAGDGITFSTFLPGAGITSIAVDPVAQNLLLSGSIALGQFPVATVAQPLLNMPYQVLLRMALDGSAVLSSTVIAPGIQSALTTGPNGTVWVDGTLSFPLLPLTPVANIGSGFAVRVSPSGANGQTVVDQTARFGGLAASNPKFASLPLLLTSLTAGPAGSIVLAGSVAPTASSSLLATQTFDLPLTNATNAALPSAVHDSVLPPGSCSSSLCAGTGAYLARLTPTAGASLALSIDDLPNLVLRNLGSAPANSLTLSSSGFHFTTSCEATLAAGDECTIAMDSGGPGSITVQAANTTAQTISLAAVPATVLANPLAFSPREIDFGVQTASSAILMHTITITNLTQQVQNFLSAGQTVVGHTTPATPEFAEASSDCPSPVLATTKQLAPGATCHVVLSFVAANDPTKDGALQTNWTIGKGSVLVTGYQQTASLSLSSAKIDFGTQFFDGLRSARYLYLSNNSGTSLSHTPLVLPQGSPFTLVDTCSTVLRPHTVCQMQFGYQSAVNTATDSITLTLEQGLGVLVSGTTLPAPGTSGSGTTPTLTVSPSSLTFTNAVVATGISSSQIVTVQNTGATSFPLALAVTGDFMDETSCGPSLAGGASCAAVIAFAPSQPGSRTGLLSVTAGTTAPVYVALSGTGTPILPENDGALDFGSIPLGQPSVQWYKVSQPFSSLSAGATGPTFKVLLVEDLGYGHGAPSTPFLAATTGSCLNCWLGVQFTPSAAGSVVEILALASNVAGNAYKLNLTGAGISAGGITLSPSSQDFGAVALHSSSAPLSFTLTNLSGSTAPINLSNPAVAGDFTLSALSAGGAGGCGSTLNPNASCLLQAVFAPSVEGQRTGSLTIATSAGSATTTLSGFGAPDTGIAFNPSAVVFANVAGTSATVQTINITNTGALTAQVGGSTNANPAFTSTTTCGTLAPAGTCTLTVTYAPTAALVSDTLQLPVTVVSGNGPILTTYPISVSSTYTLASYGVQIIPGSVDYGPATANALGGSREFTLNNLSANPVNVNVNLPRQFVLDGQACSLLDGSGSCTFTLNFLPLTNGEIPGTIYAVGTASGGQSTSGVAYIKGYGNGASALTITGNISPGRLVDFGQVPSGQTAQQILTLTNTSSAAVDTTVSTVTIRRVTSLWPFLATTNCGTTLALGQSCTVTVNYTPLNQVLPGTSAPAPTVDGGTLTIESDAVSGPDQVSLTGTATAAAVSAPSNAAPLVGFTASQNSLTFGATTVGFTSTPQAVTLTNTGNAVLHIAALTASADFTVAGSCPVLLPGASCPLSIAFVPQLAAASSGPRGGAIEITSDSSSPLEFLSVFGTATPSTLVFAPTALNFGGQLTGSTTTLLVRVSNAGTIPASFGSLATTGDYSTTSTCPTGAGSLAANATCTLQVVFSPTSPGVRSGVLSVTNSISPSPISIALTGLALQSHLNVSPGSLNFGDVAVGSTSSLSVTLANTGSSAITGLALATTGDFATTSPCAFATLFAGTSCSVTITFAPKAAGVRSGGLKVTSSDPSSPSVNGLTGNGTAGGTVAPGTGSFLLTVNGAAAATQTVKQTVAATYALKLTPLGGFTGPVVLSCTALDPVQYASCSLPSSTFNLAGGGAQSAAVTINTLTGTATLHQPEVHLHLRGFTPGTFCILAPALLFFWRCRRTLSSRPTSLLLAFMCTTLIMLTGCGGGAASNLRLAGPGTYHYAVTGTSTTGTPLTQTVAINITITE